MTRGAWAALVASVALAVSGGSAAPAAAVHATTEVPLSIAPEDVQRHRDAGEEIVLIDLRPPAAYRTGHLPRARSLPLGELRQREVEIPRSGRVVLYASTPEEAAAAYQVLRETGHRNVMVLAGGLAAWIRLGLPVEATR